jgi:hypothetical protein
VALTRHSIGTNRADRSAPHSGRTHTNEVVTHHPGRSQHLSSTAARRRPEQIEELRISEESFRAASDRPLSRGGFSVDHGASHAGFELEDLPRQDAHPGVVIASPSLDEVNELYEIRITLEPLATEIATAQLSDAELAALERILAQMRDADPTRFVELNREFHSRIYPAAKRPRLSELTEALRKSAAGYVRMNIDRYDPAYRGDATPSTRRFSARCVLTPQGGRLGRCRSTSSTAPATWPA